MGKRQLIDDLRVKAKDGETKILEEQQKSQAASERIKLVEDDITHKKSHVDSLRRQLQAVTKEKAKYETMYHNSMKELDKMSGHMSSLQTSKIEMEQEANKLEQEASNQLQTLATRSEEALEIMKKKLEKSKEKLDEYNSFVTIFSSNLISLMNELRGSFYDEKSMMDQSLYGPESNSTSMNHAQALACNILNMSKSDFEELMTPVEVSRLKGSHKDDYEDKRTREAQNDQNWKKNVEKIAIENPPFAKSLIRLLWDKVQDAVQLCEDRYKIQVERIKKKTS